eukprot:GFKZ01009276.1.p1 GENE.GFKZ01009276.1~~GFKZ01009276.1.p1  ORF type:complete len:113 (+),score=3.69 GFKZ01009276.1:244-582(+)
MKPLQGLEGTKDALGANGPRVHETSPGVESVGNAWALARHRECMRSVREVESAETAMGARDATTSSAVRHPRLRGVARNALALVEEVVCISSYWELDVALGTTVGVVGSTTG